MSDGLNQCNFIGNLGKDAEHQVTKGGVDVLHFSIACGETYFDRDKQKQERTEWVKCVIFGKLASSVVQYMTKGTRVFVSGQMRTSSYDDRDGNKRHKTEIVVDTLRLLGGRARSGEHDEQDQGGDHGRNERQRGGGGGGAGRAGGNGRSGGGAQRQAQPGPAAEEDYAGDYGGGGGSDDEIPF